ncbi:unnamed protein product [Prorocentrum cordatum]|uniref:Uncharacterized protein n=1 Tax=Prorocentrum cordatum TaxID=2364126 RepID=A0ABN9XNL7_9DINO|nr:unnamed protein product [Polarella glacialis]
MKLILHKVERHNTGRPKEAIQRRSDNLDRPLQDSTRFGKMNSTRGGYVGARMRRSGKNIRPYIRMVHEQENHHYQEEQHDPQEEPHQAYEDNPQPDTKEVTQHLEDQHTLAHEYPHALEDRPQGPYVQTYPHTQEDQHQDPQARANPETLG